MSIGRAGADYLKCNLSGLSLLDHPLSRAERTPEVVAVSGVYRGRPGGEESSPGIPRTNLSSPPTAVLTETIDTPKKPTQKITPAYYLDYEATSPSTLIFNRQKPYGKMCGSLCLIAQDGDENQMGKRLTCRREWCNDCGVIEHRRRIARVLDHLLQICPMSYIVITFPLEVRSMMRDPKVLAVLGKKVRRLLRKRGYRKLFTRWHFFGEHGEKYHPHLNVLCDGEWLAPEQLADLKDLIRRKLLPRSIAKTIGKDLDIRYAYRRTNKEMMHTIKYVTKASFTDITWDEPLANALYGFHNGCFAGFWDDPPKWKLTGTDKKFNALLKVRKGIHPVSGKPIKWNKEPIPWALVEAQNPVDIGGGYYLLPPIRSPPSSPVRLNSISELPDSDERKHPNAIRRGIARARLAEPSD